MASSHLEHIRNWSSLYLKISIDSSSPKRKRATEDDLYDSYEIKYNVMERAKEVQANLSCEFPSMIKCMLPSHVTGGFWLVS